MHSTVGKHGADSEVDHDSLDSSTNTHTLHDIIQYLHKIRSKEGC